MNKLTTCENCENLYESRTRNSSIYGCKLTGFVVPHSSRTGFNAVFLRVPMECPRPDDEVIKKECKY